MPSHACITVQTSTTKFIYIKEKTNLINYEIKVVCVYFPQLYFFPLVQIKFEHTYL